MNVNVFDKLGLASQFTLEELLFVVQFFQREPVVWPPVGLTPAEENLVYRVVKEIDIFIMLGLASQFTDERVGE